MTKTLLTALSAASLLALGACSQEPATDETAVTPNDEVAVDVPQVPATDVPVEMNDPVNNGDAVSISEDGVQATVNEGDTSINADVSDDPSLEIETD